MNKLVKYLLVALSTTLVSCATVTEKKAFDETKASDINVQLGIGYLQQNNLEVANQKLNRALSQNPNSAVAHNALGILQERLKKIDEAEFYYKKATELDPKNSQASNNYGAFLCRQNRQKESELYFLQAVKQPLYRTPEFAYTNAAVCLMQIEEYDRAQEHLVKALAARSNFANALINMADIHVRKQSYDDALVYLSRFNLVKNPTSRSLWLEAKSYLALNKIDFAEAKIEVLTSKFPDSKEFNEWKSMNK